MQVIIDDKSRDLIKQLKDAADYPLLVVNDMERGYPTAGLPTYSAMTLAATNNPAYVRLLGTTIAKYAREDGYTGTWCPVLDIHRTASDPLGTERHGGDSPEAVTAFGRELLTAFASYNFGGSGKHYPGGRINDVDTHMSEGVHDITEQELLEYDLIPYLTLWREGLLHSIMVDHSVYPKIDPDYPASMSKKVISIIRRQGFDGLLYSDSFAMMGILQKFGEKNAMVMALNAGIDIVLPNYCTSSREVYEMMLSAYREGLIPDERLDEAVRHVMAEEARCAQTPVSPIPVPENVSEIFENIARDAVTAVTLPEFPKAIENDKVLTMATKHDEVVFVTFCKNGCYLGSDGLTRRTETVIRAIAASGKISAHVHFGNPLALRELPVVPRRIFGYNAIPTQRYVFEALAGKLSPKGVFPFPKFW